MMATEVWYRDPYYWVRDAIEEGITRYTLTKSVLAKNKTDPISYMRMQFAHTHLRPDFQVVGQEGSALYDIFSKIDQPKAFWPIWNMSLDHVEDLIGLLESPVGNDSDICSDEMTPSAIRPVFGQEHRVLITGIPNQQVKANQQLFRQVAEIASEFPDAKIQVNGSYSFRVMFAQGFHAGEMDPRSVSMRGCILPHGILFNNAERSDWPKYEPWINLLGMSLRDLTEIRKRLIFQLRSTEWAAKNYTSDLRVHRRYNPTPAEQAVPEAAFRHKPSKRENFNTNRTVAKNAVTLKSDPGYENTDYVMCHGCVFRTSCKLARDGFVCTAGGSQVTDLAKYFGTRSVDQIITGLGKVLEMQATRLEIAVHDEQQEGDANPEVTRQLNSLFANGTKLAKLIDPSLNGKGVEVNIGVNGNAQVVASADPRQMVAAAIRALEDAGIPRAEITNEMITGLLTNMAHGEKQQAIEAKVIEHEAKK